MITFEGKPVANAKVIAHVLWKDDIGEKTEVHTDEHGKFNIPLKKAKVRRHPFAEFVITQVITVLFNDEEYVIWYKSLLDPDEHGGLGGYPQNIICELTHDRERIEGHNGIFSTSCKWTDVSKEG